MSLYPDWITVDIFTGSVTLVEGYEIEIVQEILEVNMEPDFIVALDNEDYEVSYGC